MSAIQERIDQTRAIVAEALARRAVTLAERDLEEATREHDLEEIGKARARLRHAQDRVEREGA